jgi:hypothetical protein
MRETRQPFLAMILGGLEITSSSPRRPAQF